MKLKEEKGITLVALAITIAVMSILAGIATHAGLESVRSAKRTAFITELEMIQAKVNNIYEKRKTSNEEVEYYDSLGQDPSVADQSKLQLVLNGQSRAGFRYFTKQDLEKDLELSGISQDVIINYNTRQVISLTGVNVDGKMYYRLEDIPDYLMYNVKHEEVDRDAPTFNVKITKLNTGWKFEAVDIVYANNTQGGELSYKLHDSENWILLGNTTSFTTDEVGIYDVRLTDKMGHSTTKKAYAYVANGLYAYYDGENNVGTSHDAKTTTWKDLSGNGHDATITGINFTQESGWTEDGLQLDGTKDNVTFPVTIPKDSNFSIDIVFKEGDFSKMNANNKYILTATPVWQGFTAHVWYNSDNIYDGRIYIGSGATTKDRFEPNDLMFYTTKGKIDSIVYTYNGKTKQATIYINGVKKAQKTFEQTQEELKNFQTAISIKNYKKISIYNRVLTESEVKNNYKIDKERFNIKYYTQEGLILNLDGRINATNGVHSDKATTWKDLSGNGHDATVLGNASFGSNYMICDGVGDYVDTGMKQSSFGQKITIEAVVNFEEISNYRGLWGPHNTTVANTGLVCQCDSGKIGIGCNPGSGQSVLITDISLIKDKICNLTALIEGGKEIRVYLNGKLYGRIAMSENVKPDDALNFMIAKSHNAADRYFKGKIYNFKVYNRVLTEAEVQQNYQFNKETFRYIINFRRKI